MNSKQAKMLRAYAEYKNQSKTPGTMPFPGVKRFYAHPDYTMHTITKTSYEPCWLIEEGRWGWYKARRQVTKMKLDSRGKADPIYEIVPEHIDIETAEVTPPFVRAKSHPVPVTKPAVLSDKEPKGVYRGLKRIHKKWGLVNFWNAARTKTVAELVQPFKSAVAKAQAAMGVAPLESHTVVTGI